MSALKTYSGPAGLTLIVSGMGVSLFAPGHQLWGWILLSVGGVLTATAIALNLEDLLNIFRGRTVRFGTNAVFYSAFVLLIVVAVNFLAARHNRRFDVTSEGIHTLAPQTVRILESLEEDLELIAFYSELNPQGQRFEDLAEEYRYHTDRLKTRLVDPLRSPGEARRYEITQDGTVVLQAATGEARITTLGEEELTNAIVKATRRGKKTICFTIGHGEASLGDAKPGGYAQVAEALRKESYETEDLLLLRSEGVPAKCSVLVVGGPTTPLLPAEVASIESYLAGGGRLMVLNRDPERETGLNDLLAAYGLRVNSDTIVDRLSRALIGDEFTPVVVVYESHPIVKALQENGVASFFPVASSVEATAATEEGVTSQVVATTGADAWGETGETVEFDPEEDHPGPLALLGAASGKVVKETADEDETAGEEPGPEAVTDGRENGAGSDGGEADGERRIVLFGDSDFASNAYLHLSGNADLFLNAAGWLAAESDLISIRPKEGRPQPVSLTAARQNLLSVLTFLSPLVAVAAGIVLWARRKRL